MNSEALLSFLFFLLIRPCRLEHRNDYQKKTNPPSSPPRRGTRVFACRKREYSFFRLLPPSFSSITQRSESGLEAILPVSFSLTTAMNWGIRKRQIVVPLLPSPSLTSTYAGGKRRRTSSRLNRIGKNFPLFSLFFLFSPCDGRARDRDPSTGDDEACPFFFLLSPAARAAARTANVRHLAASSPSPHRRRKRGGTTSQETRLPPLYVHRHRLPERVKDPQRWKDLSLTYSHVARQSVRKNGLKEKQLLPRSPADPTPRTSNR